MFNQEPKPPITSMDRNSGRSILTFRSTMLAVPGQCLKCFCSLLLADQGSLGEGTLSRSTSNSSGLNMGRKPRVRTIFPHTAGNNPTLLSFEDGDIIILLIQEERDGWLYGELEKNQQYDSKYELMHHLIQFTLKPFGNSSSAVPSLGISPVSFTSFHFLRSLNYNHNLENLALCLLPSKTKCFSFKSATL